MTRGETSKALFLLRTNLWVTIVGFITLIVFIIIASVGQRQDTSTSTAITDELRRVNQELRASQVKLDEERKKTYEFQKKRDSILNQELKNTHQELLKAQKITNEKISKISSLSSLELQREFARLTAGRDSATERR